MKTIQELILDVQDRISLPLDDDDRWSTDALIRAFNNALDDKLTPDLVAEGSNYLVHREVIQLTANGSPAFPLNSVPIPKRAVGRALREVKYLPAGKTKIEEELNCPAISLEEKDMFSTESELYGSSVPYVFLENDSLRLVGGDLAGAIVMYYSLEPSTLENSSGKYATITDYQSTATIGAAITIGSTTLYTGNLITPASLNILPGMEISGTGIPAGSTVVSITSTSIIISQPATETNYSIIATVNTNAFIVTTGISWDSYISDGSTKFVDIYRKSTGAILKANVIVKRIDNVSTIVHVFQNLSNDEIKQIQSHQEGGFPVSGPYESELLFLPAGKAEFSTIPYEFDQLLVLYVSERVLESIGDTEGLQVVMGKIRETKESISRITGNRLQGERRKLTDRRSIARIQRGRKWSRSYIKNYT